MNTKIKVFDYDARRDVFTVTQTYGEIAGRLGLNGWNPVVWIGRLFKMDNDVGKLWFENWELRKSRGPKFYDALIIDPNRFQDGRDGPCHSSEFRKRFWTDVLSSLELSLDLLFDEARLLQKAGNEPVIPDLEKRIKTITRKYKRLSCGLVQSQIEMRQALEECQRQELRKMRRSAKNEEIT